MYRVSVQLACSSFHFIKTLMGVCRANEETGLDEFKRVMKERAVDAVFLGGMLKDGMGLDEFKKEVLEAVKVCISL